MLVDFEEYNGIHSVESEVMISPRSFPVSSGEISTVNARMRSKTVADKVQTVGREGPGNLFFLLFSGVHSFLCVVPCVLV